MIICRTCHAEAHPFGDDGLYMTGCDCVPLELVDLNQLRLRKAVAALAAAFDAQDVAEHHAVARVRREFAPIIKQRRAEWRRALSDSVDEVIR